MSVTLALFHAVQARASVYAGCLSAVAIFSLQKREPQAKSAAQWSDTAAHQLCKTRVAQTSGALAVLCSTISAIVLTVGPSTNANTRWPLWLSLANVLAVAFACNHLRQFWRDQAKIPFVSDYNQVITASQQMTRVLAALTVTWILSTLLYLW